MSKATKTKKQDVKLDVLLFVLTFAWFNVSLAPTITWGDSSDLATRLSGNQILNWEGGNRDYDFYEFLAQFFSMIPIGDFGYRANLMSAFFGALSAVLVFELVKRITNSNISGTIALITLITSHTFWLLSSIAEVYTLSIFLMLSSIMLLHRWFCSPSIFNSFLLGAILGTSIYHHSSGLVLLFSHLVTILFLRRKLIGVKNALSFMAALTPLIFISNWFTGVTLNLQKGFSFSAFFPTIPYNTLNEINFSAELMYFFAFSVFNFPLILIGAWKLVKQPRLVQSIYNGPTLALTINCTMTGIAAVSSSIPDKYNMYVIFYPLMAVIIGVVAIDIPPMFQNNKRLLAMVLTILCLVNPTAYFLTWKAGDALRIDLSRARSLEGRNNNEYFVWPPKRDDFQPRIMALRRLESAPMGGLVIADYTIFSTLKYVQLAEGIRGDVEVYFVEQIPEWNLEKFVSNHFHKKSQRIFLATIHPSHYYFLGSLSERYKVVRYKDLYEILPTMGEEQ